MNLHTYPTQDQQISAIKQAILKIIAEQLLIKQEIVIAVSGGTSPIPLFEQLSIASLDYSKIIFTLVDERIVATTSNDSNENLVKTYLLKNKAATAKFIGLYNPKFSQIEMINRANKNIPQIDLAILGMGEDGHTASIFPDCLELKPALDLNNSNNYIVTNPISAKYSRISLTLPALTKIPHIILSINNATKLKVLEEANLGNNLNYPISYVLSNKPNTQIFWYK